jgi:hypothetical protein
MTLTQSTRTLLSSINESSGKTLKRSLDLGTLLQIAEEHSKHSLLDDLAFSSKFIIKSFELMQRIGRDGNGYEKLSSEFTAQISKIADRFTATVGLERCSNTGTLLRPVP